MRGSGPRSPDAAARVNQGFSFIWLSETLRFSLFLLCP